MNIYENEIDGNKIYYSKRKARKIANNSSKHYPNKDEAKLLRKLMIQTGLNEKEIRNIKTYRKMLSEAQKEGQKPKRTRIEKYYHRLIKDACEETKLPKEHPATLLVLDEIIKKERESLHIRRFRIFRFNDDIPSAKNLVKYYGKKKK